MPHGRGRPRHRPGSGGHGGRAVGGLPGTDCGPVFFVGPGRLPRMDGPALSPRRRGGLEYGAARPNARQGDIDRSIRLPPIPERGYPGWAAGLQIPPWSNRPTYLGRGGYRGGGDIGGGSGREHLHSGVRHVEQRGSGEGPRYR